MDPLYRNHFPEEIDFTKNSVYCDKHYSFQSALVLSFVMTSFPFWYFTVILSPAENPACSSQFPCKRICGGDFLKSPVRYKRSVCGRPSILLSRCLSAHDFKYIPFLCPDSEQAVPLVCVQIGNPHPLAVVQ